MYFPIPDLDRLQYTVLIQNYVFEYMYVVKN